MEAQTRPAVTGINAFAPRNLKATFKIKKANFKKGIQSKENFKQYIRTPGASADPDGAWSWSNEGIIPDYR